MVSSKPATLRGPDVIVLPCRSQSEQGVELRSGSCRRGKFVIVPPGSRPAERSRADLPGLAPQESVIEVLCCLAARPDGGGFRVFCQIPMVRLRTRPLDPSLRRRRAFFARHPYCFCLCLCFCRCHCVPPAAPVLVRQLRGPHLSTWPWCSRRSSMAVTAALSPSSFPQSSTGRFDVISVLARS